MPTDPRPRCHLMGADEEGSLARLKVHRRELTMGPQLRAHAERQHNHHTAALVGFGAHTAQERLALASTLVVEFSGRSAV